MPVRSRVWLTGAHQRDFRMRPLFDRHHHWWRVVSGYPNPVRDCAVARYDAVNVDGFAWEDRYVVVAVFDGQDLVAVGRAQNLGPLEERDPPGGVRQTNG